MIKYKKMEKFPRKLLGKRKTNMAAGKIPHFPLTFVALEVVGRIKPPVRDAAFVAGAVRDVKLVLAVDPLDVEDAPPPELAMLVLLGVLLCSRLRTVF